MPHSGSFTASFVRLTLGILASLVVATACTDFVTQVGVDDIASLRISPDSALVAVGRTLQVRALPLDSTGALILAETVTWSSTATAVASVDDDGLVTGVGAGTVEIVASTAGFEARAHVTVEPAPHVVLSADSVAFSGSAGGADPALDSVMITNGGGFTLEGLAIDSITYGAGAQDWLVAQLAGTVAPARLDLTPMIAGVTTVGTYSATVWLFALEADNVPAPVSVRLQIASGPAAALTVNDGDAQTAAVAVPVVTAPSVLVTDAFGNVVAGASVTFAVAGGGGSVTGAIAVSDAAGIARVGSWTLGTVAGPNSLSATVAGGAPITFTANGVAGSPASLQLGAGDGQTAVAGAAVSVAPSVVARDAFGNGVPGVAVQFQVTSGGGSVTGAPATSDAGGEATLGSWVLGPVVGANTLIATVAGVGDTISFGATGVPGAAASVTEQSGSAQADTIGATLAAPYAVRVADANGNGVAGVTVTWTVTAGGGSISTLSTTGTDGVASATHILGSVAGAQSVSAAVNGLAGSPVGFSSTATAGVPTSAAVAAGNGQTGTVATAVAIAPSVIVTDRAGNPTAGTTVTFAVTGGGGSIVGGTVTTDASGTARVGSWTLGTTAGANALSATVTGVTPVAFTATGLAAAATQLLLQAGNNQSSVAGTAVATPPSVRATDPFGNGVAGVPVQFAVTAGNGSVTGATPTTATGGVAAVASWTLGPVAGPNSLVATATGIAGSVTFDATGLSGAASLMLTDAGDAQTDTVAATLATPYSVRIIDALSNGVPGIPVSWVVTGGGGSITTSSITDANGVATATRVLGTSVGSQTATASVGGLAGSPQSFSATATPGAPALASVAGGNTQTATVGNAVPSAPSVSVTDQFTNPVGGVAVTFAVTGGGGSVTGATPTTNASGIAQVGSWTLGNVAGPNALSATPTGLGAVAFTATGTADVPAALVVTAGDGQSATAGSPVAVQPAVRVNDQFGNPVTGAVVTFAVTGGGGSVTGATPTSGGGGIATLGSWTLGGPVGTNTLSASTPGATPIGFTATGLVGAAASMSLSAGNAQTDTVAATLPTAYAVLVVDANNNPVSGTTVTWAAAGGGSITASSVTNASGVATATRILGTTPGTQTATGSVGGLTGSPVGFSATATAGAPATITRIGPANQTATVNTAVATDPQVIVRDRFANPVPGASVTFSVTGGSGSVVPTTPLLTLADGTATATSWTLGTVAGTNTDSLTALAVGTGITGNPVGFVATATAGAPASVAVSSGDGQTAVTSNMVANPPTVVVRDAFNNPVSGVTVAFAPSGTGSSVGTPSATTNASGLAVTTWTVVTSGNPMQTNGTHANTLTAAVTGVPSAVFSGFARYTFPAHVNPIVSFQCTGCHGVSGGLSFNGTSAQNYAAVFNVLSNCAPTITRVSSLGGVSGADVSSMMMRLVDPGLTNATCSPTHPAFGVGAPQLDTLRAWMRNAAPNN